jgi:hypothetical protein
MAYGGGIWLLTHQAWDNSRNIYWQASPDGLYSNWTWPQAYPAATHSPVGLAFHPGRGRFVMVYPGRQDSFLCATTTSVCGGTICGWRVPANCTANNNFRAIAGPAVSCRSSDYSCLVTWASDSDGQNRLRTVRINIEADGRVVWDGTTLDYVWNFPSASRSLSATQGTGWEGTYRYMLSWMNRQYEGRGERIAWDASYWHSPPYQNWGSWVFSSWTEGHLAYGDPWHEYALTFAQ